jgi:hypothetical protein
MTQITFDQRVNEWEDKAIDADGWWQRPDLAPGSAWWARGTDDQIACLRFVCPCGCGSVGTCPVKPGFGSGHWTWDGNETLPTLSPSIFKLSGCRWHGHLVKGVFVPC